jgi:hypothetical protein
MRFDILAVALLISSAAFPISRVGNNRFVSDSLDRFTVAIPAGFEDLTQNHGGGMNFSSGKFMVSPTRPVDIEMMRFHAAFPQLAQKNLAELEHFFLHESNSHYEAVQSKTSGAVTVIGGSGRDLTGLSICTGGRGVVVFAPDAELTRNAILEILQTTTFEKPCLK